MSVIRFLHSDHLRLASPLSGLADCPDWLRRAAASAVRRSVVSLFETAAAARCDFLLIAGRLTESEQDLDAAVRWLLPHAEQLRGAGIQLVLTGYKRSEQAALLPLGAILCEPHDVIEVWKNPHNEIQHHVHAVRSYRDSSGHAAGLRRTDRSFWLENHTQNFETPERSNRAAGTGELRYVTVSGIKASPSPGAAGSERLSGETATGYSTARSLTVTAGAPQAVGPSEQGVFGCRIV
ncbi:MAG: hypothetical protein KDA91_18800, partial [Planctomycetaceae bacterium]|nr:hypothetical protein [Planctomycetaceae bacterium]